MSAWLYLGIMNKLAIQILTLTLALPLANMAQAQANSNQARIAKLLASARAHEQKAKDYDAKAQRLEDIVAGTPNALGATPKVKPQQIEKMKTDARSLRNMAEEQRRLAREKTAEADRLEKA